jgi:ACS family tartrate transporter-like MFS transporter
MSPLYRKIASRLVPFLMLLYMVAFLDRVNISFAALTMNRDLGISDTFYGFAAGVFFLGYCLFEVPANILLTRIGARRWIGSLLIVWGAVSMATAFVSNRPAYVVARFLLGIAESGFYPGVIFYLTLWLPRSVRARIMALFLIALPVCNSIGSPISAHILLLNNFGGLRGWQWLFLLEGAPAVVLGIATWFVVVDNPWSAPWLSEIEKDQLARAMPDCEEAPHNRPSNIWIAIARDAATYFMLMAGLYGLSFWLPRILVSSGVTPAATGWWAALPYAAGAVAMLIVSRMRSRYSLAIVCITGAFGFAAAGLLHGLPSALASFSLASMGVFGSLPLFWSASTSRMSAKIAGAAIALVNSIGAIGGFAGPYAMGWLHDATHTYSAGLFAIAASMAAAAFLSPLAARQVPPHA